MDKKTYRSVLAILGYLIPEERHWEESGKPASHIYIHVKRLVDWADEVRKDYTD
jgi:hypothetical protein